MKLKYLTKNLVLLFSLFLISNYAFSQWNKCSGKYSDLSVLKIINVHNKLFASTNKGIIISNNGTNWDEIIEFSFPINELYYFDNVVFGIFGYNALKVTYSNDFGKTWKMLDTDTLGNYTRNVYSLLYDKGTIFLATGKGIFKTDNWGKEWNLVDNKILGNHIIHTNLLKVGEDYYALDKNKELYFSEDYGKNWKKLKKEEILFYPIFGDKNNLFGLKDDKYLYKINEQREKELFINKDFGYISVMQPFCCNGLFISSDKNRIVFEENNVIELPKIPIAKKYDLLQEAFITNNYIIVSVIDYGLWYIPYNLHVKFKE